jgi:hypothetical protein
VAHWVKIQYQRKEYIVNLDFVNTFCYEKNGRVTFWLPNSSIPIIIHPQNNWEDYQKIVSYLESIQDLELDNYYWVTITYEKNKYVINLSCISSFCYEPNNRLTFWLPHLTTPIIINPASNPDAHEKVLYYLQQKTGYTL